MKWFVFCVSLTILASAAIIGCVRSASSPGPSSPSAAKLAVEEAQMQTQLDLRPELEDSIDMNSGALKAWQDATVSAAAVHCVIETSDGCGLPCRQQVEDIKTLKTIGWVVGESPECQIEIRKIEFVKAVPTITITIGKEVFWQVIGYHSPRVIAEKFNQAIYKAKANMPQAIGGLFEANMPLSAEQLGQFIAFIREKRKDGFGGFKLSPLNESGRPIKQSFALTDWFSLEFPEETKITTKAEGDGERIAFDPPATAKLKIARIIPVTLQMRGAGVSRSGAVLDGVGMPKLTLRPKQ